MLPSVIAALKSKAGCRLEGNAMIVPSLTAKLPMPIADNETRSSFSPENCVSFRSIELNGRTPLFHEATVVHGPLQRVVRANSSYPPSFRHPHALPVYRT